VPPSPFSLCAAATPCSDSGSFRDEHGTDSNTMLTKSVFMYTTSVYSYSACREPARWSLATVYPSKPARRQAPSDHSSPPHYP
jgi:hypothetical protein